MARGKLLDRPPEAERQKFSEGTGPVLVVLFALLLPFSAQAADRIATIEIENGTRTSVEQIRNVLPVKEGDLFDAARVEQALSFLKKWGRFRSVDIEKRSAPDGLHLKFRLQEGSLISGIDIYGTYPFLSARIRRLLSVHSGELYDPKLAQDQPARIEAFYEREGFAGTEVTLDPRFNEKKGTVDLVYRIQKGRRTRYGRITVLGATVFPHGYFVSQINPLLPYEPGRLRKSLEKIRRDYQEKGYLRARVRLKELGEDATLHKAHPVLEVVEGKRATVLFEGNERVSRRTFRKILPIFTEGGYGPYEIEASVEKMKEHYRQKGFQEVRVRTERRELEEGNLLILFGIEEGPQTRVKKIRIEGNKEIRRIKKELTTKENSLTEAGHYRPKTVEEDFKALPKILERRGAFEGRALSSDVSLNRWRDKASVTFKIDEGEITRIREIRLVGNHLLPSRRLKKVLKLRERDPLSLEEVQQDQEALIRIYTQEGLPYATVRYDLLREGNQAVLTYSLEEGVPVHVGEILVVGNERTQPKAVERALLLHRGKPFVYQKLLESEAALRKAGSFRSVKIETIGLAEKEPIVHLVVRLEEYRKILLDFGATYDTDNFFTGNLTLSHLNLLGTIRGSNLKLIGGRDLQKGEILVKDPFFLGYPLEFAFTGVAERERRPGFTTIESGGSLSLLREFTPRLSLLGRYEILRTFFTNVTDSTGQTEADHTTSKFSFSLSYDRRDSFADPQRGFVAFAGLDFSNKLIASTFNFIQPKGYFAHYLKLGGRTTLMNYLRVEGIKIFGGGSITRDERLFLGGDYSLRGFDEDSVGPVGADGLPAGGQFLVALTTELQTRLFKGFKLALFLDSGSLTTHPNDVGRNSLRHAAGFGLRYITPVGPLRLDYGIKLDKQAGESVGRLHFAFGYAF